MFQALAFHQSLQQIASSHIPLFFNFAITTRYYWWNLPNSRFGFFFFVFLRHRRKILPIWRYLVLLLDIYNKSEAQLWCFVAGEELSPLPGESNFFRRFSKDSNILSNDNTPHKGTKNIQRAESLPSDRRRVDINSGTHQKTASQPIGKTDSFILQTNYNTQTSNNNKNVSSKKLEEYHKWKVSGCKGDPPAKLKISQWVVVVVVFFLSHAIESENLTFFEIWNFKVADIWILMIMTPEYVILYYKLNIHAVWLVLT